MKTTPSNSLTMVCPPVQGDNPRALASGLSPVQMDKQWYNYLILPSSVLIWLSMINFMLKFAISGQWRSKYDYVVIMSSVPL